MGQEEDRKLQRGSNRHAETCLAELPGCGLFSALDLSLICPVCCLCPSFMLCVCICECAHVRLYVHICVCT